MNQICLKTHYRTLQLCCWMGFPIALLDACMHTCSGPLRYIQMKDRFQQRVECAQVSKSCQALRFVSWSRSFSIVLVFFNEDIPSPKPFTLSLSDSLRLVQSRSTGGSFFVTRADGIDDRVKELNKIHLSTLQAHWTLMVHGNWDHYDHHALRTLVGERNCVQQLQLNEFNASYLCSIFKTLKPGLYIVYNIWLQWINTHKS